MAEEHDKGKEEEQNDNEEETKTSEKKGTEDGRKYIDFSQLPEDVRGPIEVRFNQLYGYMKQNERIITKMGKDNRSLLDRLGKVETDTTQRSVDDRIEALKSQKKEALDAGDNAKVVEIDDQIAKLRATPKKQETRTEVAQEEAVFTTEQEQRIKSLGFETNEKGDYIRPWAIPSHPLHMKGASIAAAVLEDPSFSARGMDAVLEEVDRLMEVKKPTRGSPTVLSADANVSPKRSGKPTLTDDEKAIARAMELTPEQYLEGKIGNA